MTDLPLTLRCPVGGEEWPAECYKSLIDLYAERFQYRNIHFHCPSNHDFTLRKAVNSGMFTEEQGKRIFEVAKQEVAKFKADFVRGKVLPP
jgi:hypothetical protein